MTRTLWALLVATVRTHWQTMLHAWAWACFIAGGLLLLNGYPLADTLLWAPTAALAGLAITTVMGCVIDLGEQRRRDR